MAAACASWSAAQHLSTLCGLAAKLEHLERQAHVLDGWSEDEGDEGDEGGLIKARRGGGRGGGAQQAALAQRVSELKSYIAAVADAELDGDDGLLALTASHAAAYAVALVREAAEAPYAPSKGDQVVSDLAAATLCMLSQRGVAHEPLLAVGAVPALLQLLDPSLSPCAVDNAAKALGNLSADAACRAVLRSSGGVGALVRMLKGDCPASMQAAAAASMALLAARDGVVRDSARYLGAIPLLVGLLAASTDPNVAEAARCCLSALKHANPRNADEILASLRSSSDLAKDYWRLKDALKLLDEPPAVALLLEGPGGPEPPAAMPRSPAAHGGRLGRGSAGALAASARAAARELRAEAGYEEARREVAAAAVEVVNAVEHDVLRQKISRAQRPLELLHARLDTSIALLRSSLADTRAAAAARAAEAAEAAAAAEAARAPAGRPSSASAASRRSGASRSMLARHPMRYTCDEVVALLTEMGVDAADLRSLRKAGLTGAQLLLLDEPQLMQLLGIPKHKARRLRRLQDAVRLFDAVATRVAQPHLTDIELRLWLVGQGCSAGEAGRALKLMRSLVAAEPDAPSISAWEWAAGWTWVTHALEVYGVPWRQ